jgi:2-polyprenyl-3-methyl-5-hydroxy-6-metoxy-1,4-benzoquinol methylase
MRICAAAALNEFDLMVTGARESMNNLFNPAQYSFLGHGQVPPKLANPTSQLCTQSQLAEPEFLSWCNAIKEPPNRHRKLWEFVYLLQVLETRGMLQPGRKGLGFGCGKEPLAALMASRGCSVVATDLAADTAAGKGWIETDQHSTQLLDLNERGICANEVFEKNVSFRPEDMNNISSDLRDFDFVWSSCAFEHLGSIQKGLDFVCNAMQCLKPGGIAVHTTEFNLSSNFSTAESENLVIFRKFDFESLVQKLERQGHIVSPLNLNPGTGELDRHVDLPPYQNDPHLRLQLSRYVITSIGLIIQHK